MTRSIDALPARRYAARAARVPPSGAGHDKPGVIFGASPEFWLNLQSLYELRRAEQQAGKTIRGLPTLKRRKGRDQRQPATV